MLRLSDLSGFLNEFRHYPSLCLRDGAAFGYLYHITILVLIRLVMRVVLAGLRDDLSVKLVLGTPLNQNGDGLAALVADDLTDQRPDRLFFGDSLSLVHFVASFTSRFFCTKIVLARAISRRVLPNCV